MSELAIACKTLPEFDTLQILYYPTPSPHPICWCGHHGPSKEQWEQALGEYAEAVKDSAIISLKTGRQEEEGRKGAAVKVVRLASNGSRESLHPGHVEVEECEV